MNAQHTPGMSDDARALLHYASNAAEGCSDDSDRAYCLERARDWAAHIIANATGSAA